MRKNRLKQLLRDGRPAIGSWLMLSDPFAVEVMAQTGFDWLLIDTEHCSIGTESLRNILVALKGSPTVPVVRLLSNNPDYFKIALDLGAEGIMVPMIQTADDARRAVESCRYPPLGCRGFGPIRASRYFKEMDDYCREANEEILLVAQIESALAVRNLDSILAVPGVDAIFIGQADLAASIGSLAQWKHPQVAQLVSEVTAMAGARRMPWGLVCDTVEEALAQAGRGATLLTVGGDLFFLIKTAADYLSRTRAGLHTEQKDGSEAALPHSASASLAEDR